MANQSSPHDFLRDAPYLVHVRNMTAGLSAESMQSAVQTISDIISNLYVHLPQKSSAFGTDVVRELNVLADTIPFVRSEREFVSLLQKSTKRLFDRHTGIVVPYPWKDLVAFLPVVLESCWDGNGRRFVVVSRVLDPDIANALRPGLEITHWNGTPIGTYIETLSWATEGANPGARVALALRSLTVRPLGYFVAPDEDWVNLTIWDGSTSKNISLPWRVYGSWQFQQRNAPPPDVQGGHTIFLGLDQATASVNFGLKELFAATARAKSTRVFKLGSDAKEFNPLPENLSFDIVEYGRESFGYIRIFSFEAPNSVEFLKGFIQICDILPEKIILDLRGNPGGTIPSGEILLQLFSKKDVEFGKVEFRNTKLAKRLVDGLDYFSEWRNSMRLATDTGQEFSQGIELTKRSNFPLFDNVKRKKAALIIDALCYSTTDFFAAGFRDNRLGPVIGLDRATGAGGANVWSYSQVTQFALASGCPPLAQLPSGFDFNLSVRRATRAGDLRGMPLEGLGAEADIDHIYRPSTDDVAGNNEQLVLYAASVLSKVS